MDTKQQIQDDEYLFPYHYLPSIEGGSFTISRHLYWGHTYLSYINHLCTIIAQLSPARVLDVGCGDGRLLNELRASLPNAELVGVDYSERPLLFARAFGHGKNIVFKKADITTDRESGYDVVTLIEVLEHIPVDDVDQFFGACVEALTPGGKIIVTVPSTNSPVNHKHYQHFSEESLRTVFEKQPITIEKIEFLTGLGFFPSLIRRLFSNRFFILNERHLMTALYAWYERTYLRSEKSSADRLLFVARRV